MKVETTDFDDTLVTLDTYNSDLNLVVDPSRFCGHPLTNEGFAFMWAGARATYGIMKGKICFEVKVVKHIDCPRLPPDEPNPHVVRVGFSVESTSMQLGEEPLSYGYGGTGKMSTNCQFKDFGEEFMEGDVIMGLLNMDTDPIQIGFAKNGKFLGWAYKINKNMLKGQPVFPHVLSKNCSFEVNFGQKEKPFFQLPDGFHNYTFLGCVPVDLRIRGVQAPERREDCEMIMMCGLPGAGKSTWAAQYSEKHPDKKYNVLGTNNIIDKMKVMGLPRKRNYAGRWEILIQMATKCINKMFEIGSKLRRNYILDQTNVYPTAQRRKMRNFEGFKRRAVVVVPTDVEYKNRFNKQERVEGKDVPESAVLEMKANFKLPEVCDIFDEVIFTELQKEAAEKLVRAYNEEGRSSVGPPQKRFQGSKDHSPACPQMQSPQQAGCGTGNFRGQGINRGGRSGPQGSFGGQGGSATDYGTRGASSSSGHSDFGGRNEFHGREEFGGQNFSGRREEFGGGHNEFGRRSEFGQSNYGRGDHDGRRDFGRADFEGRGMPSGNFRDTADFSGARRPAFNDYNRSRPYSDLKDGDNYPSYPAIGGMSDSAPGGYKGRQSNWFGRGPPDNDRGEKFRNPRPSMGYSGPHTQNSNDRLRGGYGGQGESQGNDFGRSGYGSGLGSGSSEHFINKGGYSGKGGSQGGYIGRGGSRSYSESSGTQGAYDSKEGADRSSYKKDGPGASVNVMGSTHKKDDAQNSFCSKDVPLGGYGTQTRSPDSYRSGESQSMYKSDSARSRGGYSGGSSRGSYGRSGTPSGFDGTRHSNYSTGSSQEGYGSAYSSRSFSGGQSSRDESQSNSENEKKSWSRNNNATPISSQQTVSGSKAEQLSYNSYTSANSGTGTSGVTGYGSYNDQNKNSSQASQQQWKGSTSYSQNAEQTSLCSFQQPQTAPATQISATNVQGETASPAAQPQVQGWNQYYQQPQQAQYHSQYYGFPPAAQGYSNIYPAK